MTMEKRWQCTVCGYIHSGEEPPATCPVCGADRSQFILLETQAPPADPGLLAAFKLHPVAAHFPGGLLPTAALFLLLHVALGHPGVEAAAFWLLLITTMVVPVSIGSGLYDWQKHFGGQKASIFRKKITLALVLLALGAAVTVLRFAHPDLVTAGGAPAWLYRIAVLAMLGCMVLLGHYGAILAGQGRTLQSRLPTPTPPPSGSPTDDWARAIVLQAPDTILAADRTGIIRLWNRGAERIFGVPADQAVGQSLDLIIPENLRQRHWEGWGKVMRSGESRYGTTELLRVPAIRGDGSRFSAEFSIVMLKDQAGTVTGVAALLRDVTEQWQKEKALQAQLEECRKTQG